MHAGGGRTADVGSRRPLRPHNARTRARARPRSRFFSQVAASMLAVAASRFSAQGYEAPLRSGFVRHGILPPSMAVAATQAAAQLAAAAASPSESKTLPTLQLSVAEYGLGVPSIM